jgi:hypothetical protein
MGHIGLGPAEAEVGDCVYRLDAVTTQLDFVFRDAQGAPRDGDGKTVELVGSCYIENWKDARGYDSGSYQERLHIV